MPSSVTHSPSLWTIVLAAGASTRLGRPKQFVRFKAKSLLRRSVETAQALTPDQVVVVIGANRQRMRSALHAFGGGVRVVDNARWEQGMSTSLNAGLHALPRRATAALLLPVDQPLLNAFTLGPLIAAWERRPARPAAACYGGRLGVPAILPRRLWTRAKSLRGDVGARDLLRRAGSRVTSVALPAARFDVDTTRDLAALYALQLTI
ncbi:MAG TPA: nucleotidyltransferase family protein [Gammaproteobacteria bacterium]|jgi:molybdenum cofactor cytidylyltransferase